MQDAQRPWNAVKLFALFFQFDKKSPMLFFIGFPLGLKMHNDSNIRDHPYITSAHFELFLTHPLTLRQQK